LGRFPQLSGGRGLPIADSAPNTILSRWAPTVILTISLLLALTIFVAAFVLAPGLAVRHVELDGSPDRPHPFGCNMAWLAIRTRDTLRVAEVLRLEALEAANWRTGIAIIYDDRLGASHVFLSPPVDGWTFVVGLSLPHPVNGNLVDKCTPMLLDLGAVFADVQVYFSYPPIDFYAWARVASGRLERAFAVGDEGVIWNKGKLSRDERSLGLKLFEVRGVRGRKGDAGGQMILHPTESHVLNLAGRWSLDPTRIGAGRGEASAGYVCARPARWRAERLRKSA
jgi:hypothetical protein